MLSLFNRLLAGAVFLASMSAIASDNSPATLDATASDPAKMGWMAGSPPPPDRILRSFDGSFFKFPAMRWSVSNFRQFMPSVNVSRGLLAPMPLKKELRKDIDALSFIPLGSTEVMTWADSLEANYTDGIVVLHKGKVIYERYFGVLKEDGQHGAMSITKSFVGTLGAMLVSEGKIDANAQVSQYLPELADSAFGDATVRQLLDMTSAIKFSEDYSDPKAEVWAHAAAGSALPKPKDYTGPRSYFEFLQTVQKQGEHGEAFTYRTANADALGWVIARVTGRSIAQLLSERIWRHMGAEQDAYITVDSTGIPFAGGGLNTGLRDMALFGELMRNDGKLNGQQIVPAAAVKDIQRGGDRDDFAKAGYTLLDGWSYRNMWWVSHNEHGAYTARGVFGQTIYIDPTAEMVIARYASHPVAGNAAIDPTSLPAYHALAKHLLKAPR